MDSRSIVYTERTLVGPIQLDDAPFFVELVNSPDWLRFIGDREVHHVSDAVNYLKDGFLRSAGEHRFGYYLVRSHTWVPMGICGFLKKSSLRFPDFGFAFMPEFTGKGIAFEACRALLDFGIDQFDFEFLDAVVQEDNSRSIRLLEKLGFSPHGRIASGNASGSGAPVILLFRWCRTG